MTIFEGWKIRQNLLYTYIFLYKVEKIESVDKILEFLY